MPKLRKLATENYTVISNAIFRDEKLKAIDRGILGTMLSLADGWDFSIRGLAHIMPDGETAIAHSLKRIEKAHYLFRKRIYKDGRIADWEYIISDKPMDELFAEEETEKVSASSASIHKQDIFLHNLDEDSLNVGNLDVENQDVENPHGNKIKNNKISKDKISSDKVSINPSRCADRTFISQQTQAWNDEMDRLQEQAEEREEVEELIKMNIGYDWYKDFFQSSPDDSTNRGEYTYAASLAEVDTLVGIIVDTICSQKPLIRVGRDDKPRSVVESRFKKLEMQHIEYALKCMMLNTKKIKNYVAYLTTVLYNASITCDFAESNELKNIDPALFIPEEFHDDDFMEKHYEHTAFRPRNRDDEGR